MKSFGSGGTFSGFSNIFRVFEIFKKSGTSSFAPSALNQVVNIMKNLNGSAIPINEIAEAMSGLDAASAGAISGLVGLDKATIELIAKQLGLDAAAMSTSASITASGTAAGGAAVGFTGLGTAIASAAKGLAAFLFTNPVGWAILATTAIAGVVTIVKKYNEYQAELRQKAIDAGNAAQEEAKNISDLYTAYQDTYSLYQENIASKEELESATNSLLDALGVESGTIQGLVGDYEALNGVIQRATTSKLSNDIADMHAGLKAQEGEIVKASDDHPFVSTFNTRMIWGKVGNLLSDKLGYSTIGINLENGKTGFEQVNENYEKFVKARDTVYEAIRNGEISQEDVDSNKGWRKTLAYFSEYEELFKQRAETIKSINETTALLGYNNYVTDHGLPQTQQEFDALTESILQSGYASERFVGTEKDVMSGLSNMFSQVPQLKDFYNKWLGDNTVQEIKDNFSNLFPKPDARNTTELREWQNEISAFDKWINGLSEEDRNIVCNIALNSDTAKYSLYDWEKALDDAKEHTQTVAEKMSANVQDAIDKTAQILGNYSAVNEVLSKQSTGQSVSVNDLFHNENGDLKDYVDALEYINGAYQLNLDKVREITKAKADEQIELNNANKLLSQSNYLDNAAQIEYWRKVLAEGREENASYAQAQIDSLLAENETLASTCTQYDLLTASLQEATGAYQNWLNAQNGPESGDLFEATSGMVQHIINTNTEGNEDYLKYGTPTYKAEVEFLVPDSISPEDEEAVYAYIKDLQKYFKKDANGKITDDLNVDKFLEDSVAAELMDYDESTGEYKIAGEKAMADFAEGLNLSLPFVQAVFGMLQDYDFHFDWSDEANKSLTDLAVQANESMNALMKMDELDIDPKNIRIDVSGDDLATTEEKIAALDATIQEMQNVKGKVSIDSEEAKEANNVIEYCLRQKQLLTEPAVMKVDTSKLTGDMQEAVQLLQDYQTALNDLETKKATVGINSDEVEAAQKKVDDALAAIEKSNAFANVGLKIDPTSQETLKTSVDTIIAGLQTKDDVKLKLRIEDEAIKNWSCEDKEADVIFGVKAQAVDNYRNQNHDVHPKANYGVDSTAVDAFKNRNHNIYASIIYTPVQNGSVPTIKSYSQANGTANAFGTARAGGNWGVKQGGTSLFGELGTEIIVDPNTGTWHTVGDHGAEFAYLPKGAIVFNHKQTESLLKYGHVAGRGKSYASGTAMVTGGGKWKKPGSTSSSSSGSTTKSTTTYRETKTTTETTESEVESTSTKTPSTKTTSASSRISKEITEDFHVDPIISDEELAEATGKKSSSSSTEKEPEKFDWIEVLIDRVERGIDRLSKTAESAFKKLSTRLTSSKKEITDIGKEIDIQQKAYNRYMKEAEYVGLDEDLALMVRNGVIDIDEYDEETQKLISEYKEFYEKALDCSEAIDDLHESLAQLYQDNFDNVKTDYDNRLGLLEHSINTYQSGIDMIQQKGYLASAKYYESLADLQRQNISILQSELSDLTAQFHNAMASGEIEEYSEAWYGFQNEINGVKEAIADANTEMLTLADNMRDAEWGVFDYTSGMISRLNDEASFLIDLMSDYDLHEDNGAITDNGMATMGLRGMNYNVYMAQANRYGDEVKRLNKLLKDDPYNTNYISRREEVLKLQRDSIKAAQEQKVAITDLVKDGIDKELESLQDLIDKYEDSLDAAKNLNDYQEKISDQAKEVASLRKQLTAYSGDESEEGRARLQKIQTQLEQAEKELAKTEYDQYISDQKDMLNELYETYEETLNKRVDDIDRVLEEQTGVINANADQISDTINGFAESMGYTVTNEMGEIWNKNTIAASFDGVMAKYDKDYSTQLTSINTTLSFIDNWVRLATGNTEKTYDAIVDTDNMMINPNAHQTLRSNGVKAYKGGGLVDYTGIAKVDGSASRPEMVLDSEDTRNFISLRNSLRNIASRPLTMSSIGISGGVPVGGIYDISDRLSAISAMTYNTGYTFGDFEINIPIDHVEDYNDLVRQLQKDKQFEEMVLDMTVNRVMGKSSLAKNKHKW